MNMGSYEFGNRTSAVARAGRVRYYHSRGCMMSDLLARITINPAQMHGRPCIRGLRVTVSDVLNLLSAGQSRDNILLDYPYLEAEDIDAVLAFAARQSDHPIIAAE